MSKLKGEREGLKIGDVARAIDASEGAIRNWMRAGLLPAPEFMGRSTRYDEAFLARAHTIAGLRRQWLTLEKIRARLKAPPPAKTPPPTAAPVVAPPSATATDHWQRIELLPGLELHVKVGAGEVLRRLAEEIRGKYGVAT